MRYAMLGGSFNPVHIGHLALAEAALAVCDRVILVPACQSPFKAGSPGASAEDRLDMLLASVRGDPRFVVEDVEIRREGISYTIDTVNFIYQKYQVEGKLGLVIGDDLAGNFQAWRNAGELARLTDLILARRTGGADFPYPCIRLDNPLVSVSSEEIRSLISGGSPWRSLAPPGAAEIILDRGLYGLAPQGIAALTVAVEAEVFRLVRRRRFVHSRNTAVLSSDIARRFGLCPEKAYLAGIAHDIAKDLDREEQARLASAEIPGCCPLTPLEKKQGALLHAPASAALLRERFGVSSPEILEAVRLHTIAGEHIGGLAKAVYIADKTEPGRDNVTPGLRDLAAYPSLNALFLAVAKDSAWRLTSRAIEISPGIAKIIGPGTGAQEQER